jgi:hypothetical protein
MTAETHDGAKPVIVASSLKLWSISDKTLAGKATDLQTDPDIKTATSRLQNRKTTGPHDS